METQDDSKRRGPLPGPKTDRYTILLEPEVGEWGKRQPEGLSGIVRRLLRKAMEENKKASP